MKKIILLMIGILLASPLVLAADVYPLFDLFSLFVEQVFGNILLAGVGITAGFLLICVFGRMSYNSMLFLCGAFFMVFCMGYFGALAAVPVFIFAFIYFSHSVLNLINSYR